MLERKERFFLVMLFVIIFSLLLYFVPKTTRFEHTLHAVILDREGNQIGTTDIALQGAQLEYLFRNTLLDVTISPFDRYLRFNLTENTQTGDKGIILQFDQIQGIICTAWDNIVGDTVFAMLYFSPELDRWMFVNTSEGLYYIATTNDAYSIDDTIEYFFKDRIF